MQETGLSLVSAWRDFYVTIGTAAAALTGLMFVATTLLAARRRQSVASRAGIEAFATPIVEHFGAALLLALVFAAPWRALWQPSLALGCLGLGGVWLVVEALRWSRRQRDYRPKLADWLWYTTLPLVAYLVFIAAAFLLPAYPEPALFAVGAAAALILFAGIRNAWDSVTFLAIERIWRDEE